MAYTYSFDGTSVGNFRLVRARYKTLNEALTEFREEIAGWNQKSKPPGGPGPYEQDLDRLGRLIRWGDQHLADKEQSDVVVPSISVGSLRYLKAALLFWIERRECEADAKTAGWPD